MGFIDINNDSLMWESVYGREITTKILNELENEVKTCVCRNCQSSNYIVSIPDKFYCYNCDTFGKTDYMLLNKVEERKRKMSKL